MTQLSAAPGSTPQGRPPLRIFLVEDSRRVRELLTEQLNDLPDVEVVGAEESERDAIESLRRTPCDVVILDIKLREGTGISVLRSLRRDEEQEPEVRERKPLRMVFSNYTESGYRQLAAHLGAKHFFDKSCDLLAMINVIRALTRRR
ncbi:MAG: response regulator transcription factor [Gammaproteobacteria bacterium]|nr:response regulator transcription factor [Gammaproteobacteria bacterium]MBI5619183.1 response regulator transcription factor [Gammaproteobacteria bacterium]